jgi:hypothetical protein
MMTGKGTEAVKAITNGDTASMTSSQAPSEFFITGTKTKTIGKAKY